MRTVFILFRPVISDPRKILRVVNIFLPEWASYLNCIREEKKYRLGRKRKLNKEIIFDDASDFVHIYDEASEESSSGLIDFQEGLTIRRSKGREYIYIYGSKFDIHGVINGVINLENVDELCCAYGYAHDWYGTSLEAGAHTFGTRISGAFDEPLPVQPAEYWPNLYGSGDDSKWSGKLRDIYSFNILKDRIDGHHEIIRKISSNKIKYGALKSIGDDNYIWMPNEQQCQLIRSEFEEFGFIALL